MARPVQRREALQVRRRPRVLAGQQRRHLALGRSLRRVEGLVPLPSAPEPRLRRRQVVLEQPVLGLDRLDRRVARQVVQGLARHQHARLKVVHESAEGSLGGGASGLAVGRQVGGGEGLGSRLGVGLRSVFDCR